MKFFFQIITIIVLEIIPLNLVALNNKEQIFLHLQNNNFMLAEKLAKDVNDQIILKIVQSQKYLNKKLREKSFEEIIEFIKRNPSWPQINQLKKEAENYLNNNSLEHVVFNWFEKNKPKTSKGYKFYALSSYKFLRNHQDLSKVIKDGWIYGEFSSLEEREYFKAFYNFLSTEDHVKHIDELLWNGNIKRANQLLNLVDKDYQEVFKAQIYLINGLNDIDNIFSRIAEKNYTNGLIFKYLNLKKKAKLSKRVIRIFNKIKPNPLHEQELWQLQSFYVREFINNKDYQSAYEIAKKQLATKVSNISDQEFILGWISLRFLKKNDQALNHFTRLYKIVRHPISLARSTYWLARTHESMGNQELAKRFYTKASFYYYTFYGQLALEKLNRKIHSSLINKTQVLNINVKESDAIKAIKVLVQHNLFDLARTYAKAAINHCDNPEEIIMIINIMKKISDTQQMLELAKLAMQKSVLVKKYAFPIKYNLYQSVNHALVYSIIRQESSFNIGAISTAEAMGLMQLTKETAYNIAKKHSIKINYAKLINDPHYNIKLGTLYLKFLLHYYKGSYVLSIAAYNAGILRVNSWIKSFGDPREMYNTNNLIDWLELIPFYETRNYVQRVLENMQIYRVILGKSTRLTIDLIKY